MFAGASLFGYTTKKDLSGLGRFFLMAMIGFLVAMLVNVFFVESTGFSLLLSFGVVILFAGVTAYETQMIKTMYTDAYGDGTVSRMAIFGAFILYGSFVTMFIHILNILAILRGEE
jgi:FtsH-binding integral membrane protein